MNRTLANIAYAALDVSGLAALARLKNRRAVPVLMYHGVTAQPEGGTLNAERNHLRADRFERHLELVGRHFRVIPLKELADVLRRGSDLPPRSAVLTFDDGYRNNFTTVYPLLKKFNFPATFYLPADPVEKGAAMWVDRLACAFSRAARYSDEPSRIAALLSLKARVKKMRQAERAVIVEETLRELAAPAKPPELFAPMTPADVREMARSSLVDFGSHACTHWPLTGMPLEDARREIRESKERLESLVGRPVESFSYPHGLCNDTLSEMAASAGYSSAVIGGLGLNGAGTSPLAIARVALGEEDGDGAVNATLSGLRAAALSVRSLLP